jgi:hypothetical protein
MVELISPAITTIFVWDVLSGEGGFSLVSLKIKSSFLTSDSKVPL